MEICTYSEARDQGLPFYFTGKPCRRAKHIARKRTSNQACLECEREKSANWKKQNPEKASESQKKTKKKIYEALTSEEKQAGVEYRKKWRAENRDRVREYVRKWQENNVEQNRQISAAWVQNNKPKKRAKDAWRRAAEIQAMPAWLTKEQHKQIEDVYELARVLAQITGEIFHVDHMVPLIGKNVCGLHVPWNLQALPAVDNLKKSNKHQE